MIFATAAISPTLPWPPEQAAALLQLPRLSSIHIGLPCWRTQVLQQLRTDVSVVPEQVSRNEPALALVEKPMKAAERAATAWAAENLVLMFILSFKVER